MSSRRVAMILGVAVVVLPAVLLARQNVARNGSMESGLGQGGPNPMIAAHWTEFGDNVERSAEANHTVGGGHALKAFGDPLNNLAGAYQEIAANPGDNVSATAWLYTRSTDKLTGTGQAGIRLEFLDIFGGTIGTLFETLVLDAGSPGDTWIEATLGPETAPSGTVKVRLTCLLTYVAGYITGSVYWDDVEVSGASGTLENGDFEEAGISTDPNPAGIDEWTGFEDQQKSDEASYHGSWSVKLGMDAAYSGLFQNLGVLQEGDEILLIARVMTPSSDPLNGSAQAGLKLEFDPVGTVPDPEENLAFDENAAADTWTQVTLQTTVPDEMTVAKIVCIYDPVNPLTEGTVYFDLAEASLNGSPNLLNNNSFESNFNPATDWEAFYSAGTSQAAKACWVGGITPKGGDCMLKTTGDAVAGVFQEIGVSPTDTLDVSAWLYTPSTDQLTGPGLAGVKVEWSPGGVPDDIDIGGTNNTITASDAPDVWHELTINYTMPVGTEALGRFTNLVAKGTGIGGTVYFDVCEAVVLNRYPTGSDSDADDDADLADFRAFQECFSGDGGTPIGWPCLVFDDDDDGDVDLLDHAVFIGGFTGP